MKKTVKVAKPRRIGWRKKLREHLRIKLDGSKYKNLGESRKRTSTQEVTNGVEFCIRRNLPVVSSILTRNFDIGDRCNCLLAKGTGLSFPFALKHLRITNEQAGEIGCLHSDLSILLSRTGDTGWCWSDIYNFLWRSTGQFFKAHPEFGVT